MSCFDGIISEYPGISVDNFSGKNLRSSVFFLSHCHLDHMKGFTSRAFANYLSKSSSSRIYCSEFTYEILTQQNDLFDIPSEVANKLAYLSCDATTSVEVADSITISKTSYCVAVTLLSAGHCPGSVMFAFDGHNGSVLYTGDFRLYVDQIRDIKTLPVKIRTLYLDSTFFTSTVEDIPTRKQAIRLICNTAAKHKAKHPEAMLFLDCRTELGYEAVFTELLAHTGHKVHVSPTKYRLYAQVPAIASALTLDGQETKWHACDRKDSCWKNSALEDSLTIKLCAMSFVTKGTEMQSMQKFGSNFRKICFSMHSSHSEILALIDAVMPARIVPCVVPPNSNLQTITAALSALAFGVSANTQTQAEPVCEMMKSKDTDTATKRRFGLAVRDSYKDDDLFDEEPPLAAIKRIRTQDAVV